MGRVDRLRAKMVLACLVPKSQVQDLGGQSVVLSMALKLLRAWDWVAFVLIVLLW